MASTILDEDELNHLNSGIDEFWHSPITSLEEAAISLRHIVPNIRKNAAHAKERCRNSPHGLSRDQSAAIYLYTMETGENSLYKVINSILRENRSEEAKPFFPYLKLLATGLRKLPSYSGNAWRAVKGDVAKRYKVGSTIRWWAFSSCSKSVAVTQNFLPEAEHNATVFMIECYYGKCISEYSAFRREDEILLLSGARLLVRSEMSINGVRVMHLKEEPMHSNLAKHDKNNSSNAHSEHLKLPALTFPKNLPPKHIEQPKKRLTCPHCSSRLIFDSSKSEGHHNICCNCKNSFNDVTCPYCHKANIWKDDDYKAGRIVQCANCKKNFQHLNCPHCSTAAYWTEPHKHVPGFVTSCTACNGKYRALNCPNCDTAHYFKNDKYKPGLRYSCYSCKKYFQAVNCPHCKQLNVWRNGNRKAGLVTVCANCKNKYQHINCPQCAEPCLWKNANYIPGSRVRCNKCDVIFQQLNCPHCARANVWTNGKYTERAVVRCAVCKNTYQHVTCPHCRQAGYFLKANIKLNDQVRCRLCSKTF